MFAYKNAQIASLYLINCISIEKNACVYEKINMLPENKLPNFLQSPRSFCLSRQVTYTGYYKTKKIKQPKKKQLESSQISLIS